MKKSAATSQSTTSTTEASSAESTTTSAIGGNATSTSEAPSTTLTTTRSSSVTTYIQGTLNNKFKNVKVSIDSAASPTQITRTNGGNFQVSDSGLSFNDPEPAWTSIFSCGAASSPTGWCNSKFDADVADQRQTLDPNQRINDIKDAQKVFYSDVPALFFEPRVSWDFSMPPIQDFISANDGLPLFDRMWIKTH